MNRDRNEQKQPIPKSIIFGVVMICITALMNIIGFFTLPKKMATQFTFNGLSNRTVPTPIYLIISLLIVLIISIKLIKTQEKEDKIKWGASGILICIANILMIIVQM